MEEKQTASGIRLAEEESLDERQADYRRLLAAIGCANDLIWEWRIDTGAITWKGSAHERSGVFGGSPPATIDEWQEKLHPEDRHRVGIARIEIRERPGAYREEYRIRHSNGTWLRWIDRGVTIDDEKGKPVSVAGASIDVTELHNTREALDLNEAKLWDLLENTADGVWEVNHRGKITFANRRLLHASGFAFDEVTGKRPEDLMPRDEARRFFRSVRAFLRNRLPFTGIEHAFTRGDGYRLVFNTNGAPIFDKNGKFQGYRGVSRDITEQVRQREALRKSERRYRKLIENASDAIFALDPDGRIAAMNPAFQRITGWPVSGWIGKPFQDLIHPGDLPLARGYFQEILSGKTVAPFALRVASANGKWLSGEFSVTGHGEDGRVTEILGIGRDISDRKEFEIRWARIQKMESIGRLAGGVAHDFNNLLTIVKGFAELLQEDIARPAGEAKLHEILASVDRAIRLSRQLLTFSRRQPMECVVFDLNKTIEGMRPMLLSILEASVELELSLAAAPARVEADPSQIEQVIINLAINARDAMPDGGSLRISTGKAVLDDDQAERRSVEPGVYTILCVQDTGCGMEDEVMEHVFEPFFTTKPFGKGTGLGLATTYGIVKQLDGHIEVSSKAGRGSEFKLYFPLPDDSKAGREAEPAKDDFLPPGKETILLVEDEPAVRQLAMVILNRMGHTVIEAEDALQALEKVLALEPRIDLLLTDMVMPGMNGRDLADKLRERYPRLKTVLMSGYSEEQLKNHGGAVSPAYHFLQKPFTASALGTCVRRVLDVQR